ncbi:MAG: DUF4231 domain-containing protein [Chloroflexi bacterium]|nr:DUF4231 domain-containing protein [Chloroflexota bacterium]
MNSRPVMRVFISSPGDVAEERQLARIVIDRLRYDRDLRDEVDLRAIAWDDPNARTPMLATKPPQDAINENLATPSQCDVVVVIFWSRMGTRLKYKEEDFESGTHFEFMDAIRASELNNGIPEVLLYRRMQKPQLTVDDPDEAIERVNEFRRVQDFFQGKLFRDQYKRILRGFNPYDTLDQFETYLENDLKKVIQMLLTRPKTQSGESTSQPPPPLWEGSPFPGLRAFGEAEAPIFVGRTRETSEVIDLMRRQRFVMVVGSSGSGKSSLIGAGVIPRLRNAENAIDGSREWQIVRFTPGELGANPLMALADRLRAQGGASFPWQSNAALIEALVNEPEALAQMVDAALVGREEWACLLLFIDQFEELITLADDTPRRQFIRVLERAAEMPRLRVLATMRADFYHRLVETQSLARLFNEGTYSLSAPGTAALLEMITRPAERAGLRYEDQLPQRILEDTGDDPGALPLMAFALDQLYKGSKADGRNLLTHEAYDRLGTVQGAIGQRASEAYDKLTTEGKAALPRVFQELVKIADHGAPTRQRAALARFADDPATQEFIDVFTRERLLTGGRGEKDEPTVEVAHEALLRSWARLAAWIDEAQDDLRLQDALRRAAAEWEEHDRSPDYLWPPSRLTAVNDMIQRRQWTPSALVRDFIKSEIERWLEALETDDTPMQRRVEIGLQFAVLPDPRPGVGLTAENLPDIAWSTVERDGHRFQIARYPVTVGQYRAFLQDAEGFASDHWWQDLVRPSGPPTASSGFANYPMNNITWHEATAFCRWLSVRSGQEIRLPTVGEWRAAARSGSGTPGNTLESGQNGIVAVGLFPSDSMDLYDLRGNVRQWGADALRPGAVPRTGQPSDSLRPLFGDSFGRLAGVTPDVMGADPDGRHAEWGFRVVQGAPPPAEWAKIEEPLAADAAAEEPVMQRVTYPGRRGPEWLRSLPYFRFASEPSPNFQLIDPQALARVLRDVRPDIADAIRKELAFMEPEILRLFRERDFFAKQKLNRYILFELVVVLLVIGLVVVGSLRLWTTLTGGALSALLGVVAVIIALIAIFVSTVRGREAAYPQYMMHRSRAEFLRREYFRYLLNLPPYTMDRGIEKMQTLALLAANLNRGADTRSEKQGQRRGGLPAYLRYDRETDESYERIFYEFMLNDTRSFYHSKIRSYRQAARECGLIGAFALLVGSIATAAAAILSPNAPDLATCGDLLCQLHASISPLLVLVTLMSAGIAIFFFMLPLLQQWERRIVTFETSLENLEVADAYSPVPQMDDRAFRLELETFAENALRTMEEEAAQFGQIIRSNTGSVYPDERAEL